MKRVCGNLHGMLLVAILMGLQGCAALNTANYGRFAPDSKVTQAFELYEVNPEMNYYFSGSDVHPNALLGLDKHYVLEPILWKPVDMTPSRMKEIVAAMKKRSSTIGQNVFGFSLLDPQGKPVGIWYSIMSATTFFQMKENNEVRIYTPDLDTYEKYESKSDGGAGVGGR